jgi:hypothetical protein
VTTANEDERSVAVTHATSGSDAWQSAGVAQRHSSLDHSDFYGLAGELVDTLHALASLCAVLRVQVAGYGAGRLLRDDEPGHDPALRLIEASGLAEQLQNDVDVAERTANRFWSAVGHIALEYPR